MIKNKETLNILLIDDDLIEFLKFKRAISKEANCNITYVKDFDEATTELKNNIPEIILLDLNIPLSSGVDFLSFLKSEEKYKHIPVIILSTSDNKTDILNCYNIGVCGYMIKPLRYEDYEKKINIIVNYWFLNEFIK